MKCCGLRSNAIKKTVSLRFNRAQLLYDIRNYAYIEGHLMPEDAECGRHTTTDVGEDGNLDRVLRILALVHAEAVELLYPYTKVRTDDNKEIDNRFWEPEVYVIELRVPEDMSLTTLHLLERLIHEYMVYRALADWLSITKPEASAHWREKAEDAEKKVCGIRDGRTGPVRRRLNPF